MKVASMLYCFCFFIYIHRVFLQRQCSGTDQRNGQGQGNSECDFSTKASIDGGKPTKASGIEFFETSKPTTIEIDHNAGNFSTKASLNGGKSTKESGIEFFETSKPTTSEIDNNAGNDSTKSSPDGEQATTTSGVPVFVSSEPTNSEINDNSDVGNQNGMLKRKTNLNVNPKSQSSSTNDEQSNTKNSSYFDRLISTLPSCKPKTLPNKLGSMLSEVVDTTPDCNPMTTPEQVAAKVMNSLGETWIIVAVVIAFLIILFYREKTYESYLHMWQLFFMFIVHLLTLLFAMRTDLYVTCHVVSFILQYGYLCHFALLLLEIGQAHAMKTNIISNGKFIGYDDTHLFFLVFPLLPTIATACFTWNEMISIYSCWLNYDNDVALCTTLILIGGFSALTFVMIEDANIKFYSPLPLTAKNQRFIARINIGTLWLRTILHFSSWLSTSFAIYVQRFALFPTAFAINVSLGVVIFVSHVGGNMKSWNAVAQAKRMVQRKRVAHVQIFEL